ncbi:S8 family serine peptidase [Archangium violaceum]|uniref:S8 family serine peptidase n=1 Tax=Archangium violaceum TaxID=83451 RepID=UPI002B32622B|nr:S8 family serine peptidase [Archangium gephyra]
MESGAVLCPSLLAPQAARDDRLGSVRDIGQHLGSICCHGTRLYLVSGSAHQTGGDTHGDQAWQGRQRVFRQRRQPSRGGLQRYHGSIHHRRGPGPGLRDGQEHLDAHPGRGAGAPRVCTPEYLRVTSSRFTGKGIKVAVLDTGVGPHRDFVGRDITARSFIRGQSPDDGHGHGTHVTGTACGPLRSDTHPRYGVACESDTLVGKVL